MSEKLTKEQKGRILKAYLRQFYGPVKQELRTELTKRLSLPELQTFYAEGNWETLRQVGAWALLHWGEQNYKAESTYDIVNRFLGVSADESEQKKPFYDTDIPLLVVYHLETTLPNKYTADCLVHVWEARRVLEMPTIILSCCASKSLRDFFKKHDVPVFQFDSGLKAMKAEVGSVEKEKKEDAIAKKVWIANERTRIKNEKDMKKELVKLAIAGDTSDRRTNFDSVPKVVSADI